MNQITAPTVGTTRAAVIVQCDNGRGVAGQVGCCVQSYPDHCLKPEVITESWGTLDVHDGHWVWEIRRGFGSMVPMEKYAGCLAWWARMAKDRPGPQSDRAGHPLS